MRELRAKLIFEEAMETVNALGFCLVYKCEDGGSGGRQYMVIAKEGDVQLRPSPIQPTGTLEDVAEIVDGCCDVAVVSTGTLSAFGIGDLLVQDVVNENNLAKLKPGHWFREDGKLMKPADHTKPNLVETIFGHGSTCGFRGYPENVKAPEVLDVQLTDEAPLNFIETVSVGVIPGGLLGEELKASQ